jgi:hypothetical protein
VLSYALSGCTCIILCVVYQRSSSLCCSQITFSEGTLFQEFNAFTIAAVRRQFMCFIPGYHDCLQFIRKRYYGTLLYWPGSNTFYSIQFSCILLRITTGYTPQSSILLRRGCLASQLLDDISEHGCEYSSLHEKDQCIFNDGCKFRNRALSLLTASLYRIFICSIIMMALFA